jgi:hypothetical protein
MTNEIGGQFLVQVYVAQFVKGDLNPGFLFKLGDQMTKGCYILVGHRGQHQLRAGKRLFLSRWLLGRWFFDHRFLGGWCFSRWLLDGRFFGRSPALGSEQGYKHQYGQ